MTMILSFNSIALRTSVALDIPSQRPDYVFVDFSSAVRTLCFIVLLAVATDGRTPRRFLFVFVVRLDCIASNGERIDQITIKNIYNFMIIIMSLWVTNIWSKWFAAPHRSMLLHYLVDKSMLFFLAS